MSERYNQVREATEASFRPTASWQNLRLRAAMLARLRACFDALGFLEVETPLLSHDTVVDRHLDPLAVDVPREVVGPARFEQAERMYLQTSPEFAMKRLLAAHNPAREEDPDADRPLAIYQIGKAFRAGERGPLHNVEFTMVEWYRVGDDYAAGMEMLDRVQQALFDRGEAERLSYREAFIRHAHFDPLPIEAEELPCIATANGVAAPATLADDRDAWLDLLLVELVVPRLGRERPLILFDYPASQSALARVRDESPPVAERFELFYRGVELANGYHELTDADELRRRNTRANAARRDDRKPTLPEESRLLAAMDHGLPPSSGCALGFDRAVMLAAGARELSEVMPFLQDRA